MAERSTRRAPIPPSNVAALVLQRAVDAVVWGLPLVGFDAIRQALRRDADARNNDIVYWSRLADSKLQVPTADVMFHHVYSAFSTVDGPIVIDVPPIVGARLFGSILDAWQVPVADVGPDGEDEGRGATYVLLPPGDTVTDVVDAIAVQLETYDGYLSLRGVPEDASEQARERLVWLLRKLRIHPQRLEVAPRQRLVEMADKVFDAIVRFDDTFFDRLAQAIEDEPALSRDGKELHDLALLGIQKGMPFRPDAAMRTALAEAARLAHDDLVRAAVEDGAVYWAGRRWQWPSTLGAQTGYTFVTDRGLDIRERGLAHLLGCMPPARLGHVAQVSAFVDVHGKPLAGEHTYRLHVPAHVPAHRGWAATVHDASTSAFIRESPRVGATSSTPAMTINHDGSVDLYFGPTPPGGDANWARTEPGKPWFAVFRIYSPTFALFDGSWQLTDLQRTDEPPPPEAT
jgi:hypothetical protein